MFRPSICGMARRPVSLKQPMDRTENANDTKGLPRRTSKPKEEQMSLKLCYLKVHVKATTTFINAQKEIAFRKWTVFPNWHKCYLLVRSPKDLEWGMTPKVRKIIFPDQNSGVGCQYSKGSHKRWRLTWRKNGWKFFEFFVRPCVMVNNISSRCRWVYWPSENGTI